MSTRTNMRPILVMNGLSLATNQVSTIVPLQSNSRFCFTFSWSGSSPVGTLTLQGSNDIYQYILPNGQLAADASNATWPAFLGSAGISGNTGVQSIDGVTGVYGVRVIYTFTSGTGTITAYCNARVS